MKAEAISDYCAAVAQCSDFALAREFMICASPGCSFRVHSQPELGAWCCIACSEGGTHGPRCEKVLAPAGAIKADKSLGRMSGKDLAIQELDEALRRSDIEASQDLAEALQLSASEFEAAK